DVQCFWVPQESPLAFLYFLDSGGGSYPEVISSAQVECFKKKSQKINSDSRVPEIIFWHIPSESYNGVAPWFMILKLSLQETMIMIW
ncbi:hypothetical protein Droror1_Dr00000004, partial [Drosera rotundifolia]